jgi:uncharacterized protein (TIGR02246 family)
MSETSSILNAANAAWNAAFNSGDTQKLASFYAENATLSPGNGQTLNGRGEIENLFRSFVEAGVYEHTLETVSAGGDDKVIFQVAKWGAKVKGENGQVTQLGGITMNTLEKDASGNWLTRAHVWNAAQ